MVLDGLWKSHAIHVRIRAETKARTGVTGGKHLGVLIRLRAEHRQKAHQVGEVSSRDESGGALVPVD
jgi:hypothetical protein